jgi:hypothetical protein
MDNGNFANLESKDQPEPTPAVTEKTPQDRRNQRLTIIGVVIGAIILIALLVLAIIYLANPSTPTEKIRDIFIIGMALEFLVIGLAMIILIIQLATLINLLQNEVKPILNSTNETANTLRGTAIFLSDNLIDPVIKLNEYLAGLRRFMKLVDIARKK